MVNLYSGEMLLSCTGLYSLFWKNTHYSKPSPFAGFTFLKIPMNSQTTKPKIKILWKKWD